MAANTNNQGDYQTLSTLETFSFLPKLTQDEIYAQINYIIAQGWTPSIEHEHPSRAFDHYWTMWKLPFFGETHLAVIIEEMEACRRTYPDHHVKVVGYDNYTQCQGHSFVAFEGR